MNQTKYYRVGAFHRSGNTNQVIIRARDREEAKGWVDRVKQMLYPGEDTSDYPTSIFEFKLQINLNNLNHYRIIVERPKKCTDEWDGLLYVSRSFDALIEAKNEDEARKIFLDEYFSSYAQGNKPEDYDIYADEIPLKQLLENELEHFRVRLANKYITDKFGDLSVREYTRLMRDISDAEEKEQIFYKSLTEHLKSLRITEYLEKRINSEMLSHDEFCKIKEKMENAKNKDEFEDVHIKAIKKYGKEGITY